ncbi:MAG: SDR family oxidoreductase [Actinomycetota bacterium]|nr:SDR family oxidoreductase [Actinomycetota bacterium]
MERRGEVLLDNKTAVVYGGGPIGGAVARAFAREGARVCVAGRTEATLDKVAQEIRAAGGKAETAQVDALDERSVDDHADALVQRDGSIDVSFNAIGFGDIHGTPVLQMTFEDFVLPISNAIRSQFLTARAASRHMIPRGSGVILAITATTARQALPDVGGTGVRFDATESLCRQLAAELGPSGIRVLALRTSGIPEAIQGTGPFPDYGRGTGDMTRAEFFDWAQNKTMLKRMTSLSEFSNVAAFMASDQASAMTGSVVNVDCGAAWG